MFVLCKYAGRTSERTLLKRLFRTDIWNSGTCETLSSNESTQTLRNITEWSFYYAGCHKTQLGIKMAVPACEVILKLSKRSGIIPSTQEFTTLALFKWVFTGDSLTSNNTSVALVVVLNTVELIFEGFVRRHIPD